MKVWILLLQSLIAFSCTGYSKATFTLRLIVAERHPQSKFELWPVLADSSYCKVLETRISGDTTDIIGSISADAAGVILQHQNTALGKYTISDIFFVCPGLNVLTLTIDSLRSALLQPANRVYGEDNCFVADLLPSLQSNKASEDRYFEQLNRLYDSLSGNDLLWALSEKRSDQAKWRRNWQIKFWEQLRNCGANTITSVLLYHTVSDFELLPTREVELFLQGLASPLLMAAIEQRMTIANARRIGNDLANFRISVGVADAKTINLKEMLGDKYTLIDFWFAKCGACIRQFPLLDSLAREFGGSGFSLVSITIDQAGELAAAQKVLNSRGLTWTLFHDKDQALVRKLGIDTYPFNLLLDSGGRIVTTNIEPVDLRAFLSGNASTTRSGGNKIN